MILTHQGYHVTASNKKVHGILFDGAWLWEEYLAKILPQKYIHYTKGKPAKVHLFENKIQEIIPDYVNKEDNIVADAKYIPLDNLNNTLGEERANAIYYKTIAYMCRFNSSIGYLFYPSHGESKIKTLTIQQDGKSREKHKKCIIKLGLQIPKETEFSEFCEQMQISEKVFNNNIEKTKNQVEDIPNFV